MLASVTVNGMTPWVLSVGRSDSLSHWNSDKLPGAPVRTARHAAADLVRTVRLPPVSHGAVAASSGTNLQAGGRTICGLREVGG